MDQHVDKNSILDMWTWGLFINELKKQFMPAMLKCKCQAKLDLWKLKQDKGSIKDFFTKLDTLAIQAGYTMRNFLSMAPFINAISHNGINNEIVKFVARSQPALLDDYDNEKWKAVLIRAETALMEINRCKGTKLKWYLLYSSFSQNPNTMKPPPSASNNQPCPKVAEKKDSVFSGTMEITYGRQGQLMDLSRARAVGLCFKCGEKGHLVCDCKNASVFRTRQVEQDGQVVEFLEKIEVPKGDFPNSQ